MTAGESRSVWCQVPAHGPNDPFLLVMLEGVQLPERGLPPVSRVLDVLAFEPGCTHRREGDRLFRYTPEAAPLLKGELEVSYPTPGSPPEAPAYSFDRHLVYPLTWQLVAPTATGQPIGQEAVLGAVTPDHLALVLVTLSCDPYAGHSRATFATDGPLNYRYFHPHINRAQPQAVLFARGFLPSLSTLQQPPPPDNTPIDLQAISRARLALDRLP